MNINSRIKLLSKLGRFFSDYLKKNNNEFDEIIFRNVDKKIEEVKHQNSFFDLDNIKNCFDYWAQNLNEKNLKSKDIS
jgi:branched-subunit amino acid aminotransferase/4-amino-4-deoxychorismate lyase